MKAEIGTISNIITLARDTNSLDSPLGAAESFIGVSCNAADALNAGNVAGNVINVMPSSPSVQLGQSVNLTANTSVTWSVLNNTFGDSLGTLSSTGPSTETTYVAPFCSSIFNLLQLYQQQY
jgi:hypothetical protein